MLSQLICTNPYIWSVLPTKRLQIKKYSIQKLLRISKCTALLYSFSEHTSRWDIYCFIFFMLNWCSLTFDASIKNNIHSLLCLWELEESLLMSETASTHYSLFWFQKLASVMSDLYTECDNQPLLGSYTKNCIHSLTCF